MNVCELCQLSSPSGCAKLDNESCLKEAFQLLRKKITNGDVVKAVFNISLDDFKHTWGGGTITDDWWNTPYERR